MKINFSTSKYLFWLAPMLILAGLTAGLVAGSWGPIPLGLIGSGLGILLLGVVVLNQRKDSAPAGFWGQRSTRTGANALVATLAVLAILGLINFLGVRYVNRLDLTETQTFSLAPETQQLLSNLKQPLKAWVFVPQANPQDRELLEAYRRRSDRFQYEFVDPNAQPNLAQRLEIKSPGDVILSLEPTGKKQFVQTITLNSPESLLNEGSRLSEVKLTGAIAQITSDRQFTVYQLQGHGERALEAGQGAYSQAAASLKDRGYTLKPFSLLENKTFPVDASVVILAGPQKALLPGEITALKEYLNRGGSMLLLVDPNTDPKITPLLDEWGVTLDPRLAIDASGRIAELGPVNVSVTQYGNHPITQELTNVLSLYPLARPVDIKETKGVQATPLLFSSDRSWAESDIKNRELNFNPPNDRPGPLVLGYALTRPAQPPAGRPAAPPASESRLVVIGNSSFAADGLFDKGVNGDVFLNSVRWLSRQDQQALSIRPKEGKNRRLNLTTQQATFTSLLALAILPLLGFAIAFFLWWRRR